MSTRDTAVSGASLSRALGYVVAWAGRTVVVKLGGSALAKGDFGTVIRDVVLLEKAGLLPILVHGGGPEISENLERLGIEPQFDDGLRVTDAQTIKVVEMVLGGTVNKRLVGLLQQAGGRAVGLTGKDGGLLRVRPHPRRSLGFVGEIESVDQTMLHTLSASRYIPVVGSLGVDSQGATYNLNADTAAAEIAVAVGAEKLLVLTDVEGISRGAGGGQTDEATASRISRVTVDEASTLIDDGTVSGGMIPKLRACIAAVEGGVSRAHIVSAAQDHALLRELFTSEGIGTMVHAPEMDATSNTKEST